MSKRIIILCGVLLLSMAAVGCSKKPPYDAKVIDSSEVDAPAQKTAPPSGGGKALKDSQW